MKKILSLLIALVMLVSTFPLTAYADSEEYALYVGGLQVNTDNAADVLGDGSNRVISKQRKRVP